MTNLLGISGSLRKASTNTMLLRNAAAIFNPDTFVEGDIRFPLYDGDLETADGIPAAVQTLADQIKAADAVIIATPEYNKAMSGVLKNALDWVSRTEGNPWKNKPLAIMSATAGRAGGERTQFSLRLGMMTFRPHILQGPEVLVANSNKEFDNNGKLTGELYVKLLTELMDDLRALV
ncbi:MULTISPECIES: NAD(P)H-dependent oxidoreductase [unclassified Yoonia]|uniref:NADPH-dependent FMN reductase n=1 Tax=unclassified Yoonia TaxID=2629118 RepID=UPI002AFDE8B3|nr:MULTISPECIES: NAD(P)H-dependent oxidoreductase [unclassified Yoonia]